MQHISCHYVSTANNRPHNIQLKFIEYQNQDNVSDHNLDTGAFNKIKGDEETIKTIQRLNHVYEVTHWQ